MSSGEKVKVSYKITTMGSIKIAHIYVDNLSGKNMFCKFTFTLDNLFHSSKGDQSTVGSKSEEYPLFLYSQDSGVHLVSFPIINNNETWKYTYKYSYWFPTKAVEYRELPEGVFLESFAAGGFFFIVLKNTGIHPVVRVKIVYTALTNLERSTPVEEFVPVHNVTVLPMLMVMDTQSSYNYKYKSYVEVPENAPREEDLKWLTYYNADFSFKERLIVERREISPGVIANLVITQSAIVLCFENTLTQPVIVHDLKATGADIKCISSNIVVQNDQSMCVIYPNDSARDTYQVVPVGFFDFGFSCSVISGRHVEENKVKPTVSVLVSHFVTFDMATLSVKNMSGQPLYCYFSWTGLDNCSTKSRYRKDTPLDITGHETKLYSTINKEPSAKFFNYKYNMFFCKESVNSSKKDVEVLSNKMEKLEVRDNQSQAISDFVKTQVSSGSLFKDRDFPANSSSVYHAEYNGKKIDKLCWARAGEIMTSSFDLFCDGIEPDDIKQGSLGDCWFLSALAAVSSQPHLIERLFITKNKNEAGIYEVKLCIGGEWTSIIVDDMFPVDEWKRTLFAHNHSAEMWVMTLEKGEFGVSSLIVTFNFIN